MVGQRGYCMLMGRIRNATEEREVHNNNDRIAGGRWTDA